MFSEPLCGGVGVLAMWQWTHSIGSEAAKGRLPGQHLVKGHAERIEVAARIDGAVHSSGLLGRHIGQRAGDDLGRPGRLPLARQAGRDAEARQPIWSVAASTRILAWLDVLVDEAALVHLAKRAATGRRRGAGNLPTSIGRPMESAEQFAAGLGSSSRIACPR